MRDYSWRKLSRYDVTWSRGSFTVTAPPHRRLWCRRRCSGRKERHPTLETCIINPHRHHQQPATCMCFNNETENRKLVCHRQCRSVVELKEKLHLKRLVIG